MNDERQIKELLMTAAELPHDIQPPVARLLRQGHRRRARRTTLMAATAAVAVLAAGGIPAAVHALRAAPGQPGGGGLFGPRPPASAGPAATQLARFRWSTLPPSPLGTRDYPVVAWTGRELLEFGGLRKGHITGDGAAFDPATGRWHRIAGVGPRTMGFLGAPSVWTGRQLFVANEACPPPKDGSGPPASCPPRAGLYNPVTNRWTRTTLPGGLYGLDVQTLVWTGRDVILAGVNFNNGRLGVAAYNPATGRWRTITPAVPVGHRAESVTMTATTSRLILWSMWSRGKGTRSPSGVDVLSMGPGGTWRDVTDRWPQHRTIPAAFFTGSSILVSPGQRWCSLRCREKTTSTFPGYFVDPVTMARTTIPAGPIGSLGPEFVWTGRAILAVNNTTIGTGSSSGNFHITVGPGLTALFDPGTGRWQRLPHPPDYPHVGLVSPVWDGHELLLLSASGRLLALHG
jgi:hypothetical protein